MNAKNKGKGTGFAIGESVNIPARLPAGFTVAQGGPIQGPQGAQIWQAGARGWSPNVPDWRPSLVDCLALPLAHVDGLLGACQAQFDMRIAQRATRKLAARMAHDGREDARLVVGEAWPKLDRDLVTPQGAETELTWRPLTAPSLCQSFQTETDFATCDPSLLELSFDVRPLGEFLDDMGDGYEATAKPQGRAWPTQWQDACAAGLLAVQQWRAMGRHRARRRGVSAVPLLALQRIAYRAIVKAISADTFGDGAQFIQPEADAKWATREAHAGESRTDKARRLLVLRGAEDFTLPADFIVATGKAAGRASDARTAHGAKACDVASAAQVVIPKGTVISGRIKRLQTKMSRLSTFGRRGESVDKLTRASVFLLKGESLDGAAAQAGYKGSAGGAGGGAVRAGDRMLEAAKRNGFQFTVHARGAAQDDAQLEAEIESIKLAQAIADGRTWYGLRASVTVTLPSGFTFERETSGARKAGTVSLWFDCPAQADSHVALWAQAQGLEQAAHVQSWHHHKASLPLASEARPKVFLMDWPHAWRTQLDAHVKTWVDYVQGGRAVGARVRAKLHKRAQARTQARTQTQAQIRAQARRAKAQAAPCDSHVSKMEAWTDGESGLFGGRWLSWSQGRSVKACAVRPELTNAVISLRRARAGQFVTV